MLTVVRISSYDAPRHRFLAQSASVIILLLSTTSWASFQEVGDLPPPLAELPTLPKVTKVESFVDGLSRNDAAIEIKLGRGRILTLKQDLFAGAKDQPSIAVGDPGILDFAPVSSRHIRLLGTKLGSTDLSITTADGKTLSFEVNVVADLDLLRGQLRQTFPDADIKIGQAGDHIVVEGEARDPAQISQILRLLQNSISSSVNAIAGRSETAQPSLAGGASLPPVPAGGASPISPPVPDSPLSVAIAPAPSTPSDGGSVKILNLLRVPGAQQVLLKVRVAELNRTALRQIGANVLGYDSRSGSIFGTQIGNSITGTGAVTPFTLNKSRAFTDATGTNSVSSAIQQPGKELIGTISSGLSSSTTLFGIFQNSNFDVFLNALRRNSVLKILAEPNLVTLNGHKASFLAGGEFPIPVPQVGATGVASTITVNFKKFGVQLDFLPIIIDGDTIRLTVDPEVSSIDFSIGTTLIAGGSPVPGLNTRKAHTTVELHEGQTLAIAGLMQLTLDGQTSRIPGLGDLPILGPFFSNTTSNRVEKELVVLVTPYLVEGMGSDQVPPAPGDEVNAPNDLEFYFLNRIEGRTGRDFRATTDGADPLRISRHLHLERKYVRGPSGFSD